MAFDDFIPSGNQAVDPGVYDIENEGIDPEGTLWRALVEAAPWTDKSLVDLGCGAGWWLPKYSDAAELYGVEPDETLLDIARGRDSKAKILHGSAEHIPLADDSVDVVHARFAYFFPHPTYDVSPGLREVARVLRPGGTLVVIDNDTVRGEFAKLLKVSVAAERQGENTYTRQWWTEQGSETRAIMSSWEFQSRSDLESVIRLEFPSEVAENWLAEHPERTGLSYGYLLHIWVKPGA